MSRAKDYIPGNDAEFENWFGNLTNYVMQKTNCDALEWDHIPKRHIDELLTAFEDWRRYYDPTLQPNKYSTVSSRVNSLNSARCSANKRHCMRQAA